MAYLPLLMILLAAPAILYLRYRQTRSHSSDRQAIDEFLAARGLKPIAVEKGSNRWRYWIRGHWMLSNCARLYIVKAEEPSGQCHEIHVAFDSWPFKTRKLQVLMEK